jgi:hypothetical protein
MVRINERRRAELVSVSPFRPGPGISDDNEEGWFAMTRDDIVQLLNHTAASLLAAAPSIPGKANDLRCIAARLQIVSMDIEDMFEERGTVVQFASRR